MDNTTQMILDIMQAEEEEHQARMRIAASYLHHQRQIASSISVHGGSTMNRRVINRNREEGHIRLYEDYFSDTPTYTETQFRRRFRMRRSLFLRIEEAVVAADNYFTQRTDAVGVRGLSSLQKVTAALRMLAYGTTADAVDDYVRIGESTAIESLKKFVKTIVEVFGAKYLRRPNDEDVSRLLAENKQRSFPGMLGSIDCMHWKWKNCPTAWQESNFSNRLEGASIPSATKADLKAKIFALQSQVMKAKKEIAEAHKRKAIEAAIQTAEEALSKGKTFCISRVDVGSHTTAIREAVVEVMEEKGMSVMVLSRDEALNKAFVCAGVPENDGKYKRLNVTEWLKKVLEMINGKGGGGKRGLAQGQGSDALRIETAIHVAESFALKKLT